MKKTKKIAALLLAAVLLVSATVAVTVAYLTSSATAVNTFTVGNVVIDLDEYDYDADSNTADNTTVTSEARDKANEYHLLPGGEYRKDPTVTVKANSEESYVRMIVTISDLADVKAALGVDEKTGAFLPQYFVEGWDNSVWVSTEEIVEKDNTAVYEFRYYTTVPKSEEDTRLPALFTEIKVPKEIDNAKLDSIKEMEINVVAHAIQAAGFTDINGNGSAEDEAWANF